jgi:hypothetical protein
MENRNENATLERSWIHCEALAQFTTNEHRHDTWPFSTCDTRILNKSLEDTLFFEEKSILVHTA